MLPVAWVCRTVELTSWFTTVQVRLNHIRADQVPKVMFWPGHVACPDIPQSRETKQYWKNTRISRGSQLNFLDLVYHSISLGRQGYCSASSVSVICQRAEVKTLGSPATHHTPLGVGTAPALQLPSSHPKCKWNQTYPTAPHLLTLPQRSFTSVAAAVGDSRRCCLTKACGTCHASTAHLTCGTHLQPCKCIRSWALRLSVGVRRLHAPYVFLMPL